MIQIMKASAGSGKTFNLARKYITLLFMKDDYAAYRHILAVTFTNKATDEMKNRILKELYVLSSDPVSSPYLKWFIPDMFSPDRLADVDPGDMVDGLPDRKGEKITIDSLKSAAKDILCNILHDYSAFSVSTIDRFFQQTLKSFSREIGQFSSYQVELDKEALVGEAVDRIFDSLTEDSPLLLGWLTECAIAQVEDGGNYDITRGLERMASRLKSDEYRNVAEDRGIDPDKVYSYENLQKIRKICVSVTDNFVRELGARSEALLGDIKDRGLEVSDFYRSFPKVLHDYVGLPANAAVKVPEVFIKRASDPDLWFAKSGMKKNMAMARGLEDSFAAFCSFFMSGIREYNTARQIAGQLYELGLSGDINREFEAVLKDRNVLSIDDSNRILKEIIDGSDAPFVYEKIGVRYENFLLDEFQDTSRVQWDNFRPLLENSCAQGFENLIVGDVKQSIYRWRGSEWKLLQESLEKELPECRTTVLDTNFRSLRNIVDFNNSFFPRAAGMLDASFDGGDTVSGIYSDAGQKTASLADEGGVVDVSFCRDDMQLGLVLKTVCELRSAGAGYGDMAVLVRRNKSGAEVAEYLIAHSVPVITDDSLTVKSSGYVRKIVSVMSCLDNPQNTVCSYMAGDAVSMLKDNPAARSLPDLCEAIARSLRSGNEAAFDAEATYIQSFMDCVLEYSSRHGNSIHEFLEYWDGVDPAISSPALSDAVRIITVHKSKGLDFKYVIFPFAETVTLFTATNVWCSPDFSGTSLEPAGVGIYDIRLSGSSGNTLFDKDFRKEKMMQYIDSVNLFYVALTRAVKGMHIIASMPSDSFMKTAENDVPDFRNMSHVLYTYLHRYGVQAGFRKGPYESDDVPESFRLGEVPSSWAEDGKGRLPGTIVSCYPTFALNPGVSADGAPLRDRLVFSADSEGYFSDEGRSGLYSSGRLRGIILHDILSKVKVPGDLDKAVADARASGILGDDEAAEAARILADKLEWAAPYDWFPESGARIMNETSLIDSDGRIYRPDRVILRDDGRVTVIDYKFGEKSGAHRRQILKYADMWRRRGYPDVDACIWYVMLDEVVAN